MLSCKIFQLLWPLPNDDFYRKSYTGKWDNAGLVSLVKITKAYRKVDPLIKEFLLKIGFHMAGVKPVFPSDFFIVDVFDVISDADKGKMSIRAKKCEM